VTRHAPDLAAGLAEIAAAPARVGELERRGRGELL
jgi:hypothetical protein